MSKKYVPAWKHKDGDRLIFAAPNMLFDTWDDALMWQMGDFIFYIPAGVTPDGIIEVDLAENGHATIPHIAGSLGLLGECCIIAGPAFDKAMAAEQQP